MKYIVLEIQTNNDGTIGTIITSFDTRNQAESQYHLVLSSAAVSKLPMHSASMLTSDGKMLACQSYTHAVEPEPTPEQTPEPTE
jgi:hypothetical protein